MTEPKCTKTFTEAMLCKKGCKPCVISEGGKLVIFKEGANKIE